MADFLGNIPIEQLSLEELEDYKKTMQRYRNNNSSSSGWNFDVPNEKRQQWDKINDLITAEISKKQQLRQAETEVKNINDEIMQTVNDLQTAVKNNDTNAIQSNTTLLQQYKIKYKTTAAQNKFIDDTILSATAEHNINKIKDEPAAKVAEQAQVDKQTADIVAKQAQLAQESATKEQAYKTQLQDWQSGQLGQINTETESDIALLEKLRQQQESNISGQTSANRQMFDWYLEKTKPESQLAKSQALEYYGERGLGDSTIAGEKLNEIDRKRMEYLTGLGNQLSQSEAANKSSLQDWYAGQRINIQNKANVGRQTLENITQQGISGLGMSEINKAWQDSITQAQRDYEEKQQAIQNKWVAEQKTVDWERNLPYMETPEQQRAAQWNLWLAQNEITAEQNKKLLEEYDKGTDLETALSVIGLVAGGTIGGLKGGVPGALAGSQIGSTAGKGIGKLFS